MASRTLSSKRVALIVSAAALLAAFALPAAAMAKTTTRILVTSTATSVTKVVDWSDPNVRPADPVITARLQKKTSSGWKTLAGTIHVYLTDSSSDPAGTYRDLKVSGVSSVKYALSTRGTYKFYYKGTSSTYKAANGYAKRVDYIGDKLTFDSAAITRTDATWTSVTMTYSTDWNTNAYPFDTDSPVYLDFDGTFENTGRDTYSGNVDLFQDIWDPQTIVFSFRVLNTYIDPILRDFPLVNLDTTTRLKSSDPWVQTKSVVTSSTPYPTAS